MKQRMQHDDKGAVKEFKSDKPKPCALFISHGLKKTQSRSNLVKEQEPLRLWDKIAPAVAFNG